MINLIGNELKKVFKKKTIYILFIIIIGYIILSNIILKLTDTGYGYNYYYEDIDFYKSYISELDPNSPEDYPYFAEYTRQIRVLELTKEYGNSSWQAYIINNKLAGYIDTIIDYEYSKGVSQEAYTEAKSAYDEALVKLETGDWKYFAQKEIEYAENSIKEQEALLNSTQDHESINSIKQTIANLKVDKQTEEWRLEKNISYAPSFLNTAIQQYYINQTALNSYLNTDINNLPADELSYYNNALENANLNKYYIENNIDLDSNSREVFINLFGNYELFIILVGIVIAGSIVSEEFNRGTIKLLLVKPYSRIKILLSKFIVCLIILILTIVFIYLFQLIAGGIIHGFDGMTTDAIIFNFDTNKVENINIFAYVGLTGLCKLPMYILLTALAFTCSTLFTNTAIAVSVPFLGYIASSIINQFALLYDIRQVIYFVTPNWDLNCYLFGGTPMFEGLTLPFSIAICTIYLAIMLVINCIVFKKRDIKNI